MEPFPRLAQPLSGASTEWPGFLGVNLCSNSQVAQLCGGCAVETLKRRAVLAPAVASPHRGHHGHQDLSDLCPVHWEESSWSLSCPGKQKPGSELRPLCVWLCGVVSQVPCEVLGSELSLYCFCLAVAAWTTKEPQGSTSPDLGGHGRS